MLNKVSPSIAGAAVIATFLCISPVRVGAQDAFFMGLGDLPGGDFWSEAKVNSISADGSTIVGVSKSSPDSPTLAGTEAFRWTQSTGMVGLGFLPGGTHSTAAGVSADGSVVVGGGLTDSGGKVFRWTQTDGMIELGLSGFARGVSADGSVVVAENGARTFRWTQSGGWVDLGFAAGHMTARPTDISADGSVIVGTGDLPFSRNEGFRWTQSGGMVGLGFVPGESRSRAQGVSADGSVVVGTVDISLPGIGTAQRAARWTQSNGWVELGALPGGSGFSSANSVSADGNVIPPYSSNP